MKVTVHNIFAILACFFGGKHTWAGASKLIVSGARSQDDAADFPVVAGIDLVSSEETQRPLLVDAFMGVRRDLAHVIFSFMPMASAGVFNGEVQRLWQKATWKCQWEPGEEMGADVVGSNSASQPGVVLNCPMGTKTSQEREREREREKETESKAFLNIKAMVHGKLLYERRHVPVSYQSFVKSGSSAVLCTMIRERANGEVGGDLKSWIQYHLHMGFDQVLIYFNSKNNSITEQRLRPFLESGRVTAIPFYFGDSLENKPFVTQTAQEAHCLYQAKGRSEWVGHADVDEFFDVPPKLSLKSLLASMNASTASVQARSAFWDCASSMAAGDSHFPCNLDCRGDYIVGARTKTIFRPEDVTWLSPHIAEPKNGMSILIPDPDHELRVNHFKGCSALSMKKTAKCNKTADTSFRNVCIAAIAAVPRD